MGISEGSSPLTSAPAPLPSFLEDWQALDPAVWTVTNPATGSAWTAPTVVIGNYGGLYVKTIPNASEHAELLCKQIFQLNNANQFYIKRKMTYEFEAKISNPERLDPGSTMGMSDAGGNGVKFRLNPPIRLTNGTGVLTESGTQLVAGANTLHITGAGTFTVSLPGGASATLANGTATVTPTGALSDTLVINSGATTGTIVVTVTINTFLYASTPYGNAPISTTLLNGGLLNAPNKFRMEMSQRNIWAFNQFFINDVLAATLDVNSAVQPTYISQGQPMFDFTTLASGACSIWIGMNRIWFKDTLI